MIKIIYNNKDELCEKEFEELSEMTFDNNATNYEIISGVFKTLIFAGYVFDENYMQRLIERLEGDRLIPKQKFIDCEENWGINK